MPDLHVATSLNTFLILLAAIGAGAFAYVSYRVTLPPVSRLLRSTLTTLRGLSLFLLFLLLDEPLLSLLYHHSEKPVFAVLVDQSKSMTIQDRSGDRKERLLKVLDAPAFKTISSNSEVLFGAFDTKLRLLRTISRDSLTFAGDGTDIGGALKQLKGLMAERNLQGVLLLTDGTVTSGPSPLYEAEELGIPVFTVGIGDSSEPHDVLVRRVVANTITYVGNKVPVDATIKSSGTSNERVEVTLLGGGKTLDRKTITLESGTREYDVPLSFTPDQEGTQKFAVEVSHLAGEISYQNNRSSFFVKVLKSKMQVVLVAGAPSADVSAIRRALEDDKNIEVKTFIGRGGGQFYEGLLTDQVLREADCMILVGYPRVGESAPSLTAIARASEAGKGLFFIPSRSIDLQKLKTLEPFLPFVVTAQTEDEGQLFFSLSEDQRNHPILRSSIADVSSKLPPVFVSGASFHAKPEAEVLAHARVQNVTTSDPLFLSRRVNRSKSLALACFGIWRWKTYSDGIAGAEQILEHFMSNSVRWLVTREDERPVQVHSTKEVFGGSDPVEFTAQVYDDNYTPIDAAEVSLSVSKKDQSSQLSLTSLGNGRFEGALDPLPEGDYNYIARAMAGGRQLTEEKGTFSVGGLNAEFLDTKANTHLLQQIAIQTGGRYYEPEDLRRLPDDLAALPGYRVREVNMSQQLELWNNTWMLGLLIGLLALEWILRKRYGML
jgi:hypothetical protein